MQIPRYKEQKALAAASMLLELSGRECDKYWLNKVMYFIERQSLIESGQPMFFDKLYAAPYGPIVSAVNDGIDSTAYPTDSNWSKHFSLVGNTVHLKIPADYSVLSPFETEIITGAFSYFNGWSFTELLNYFHQLPENKETKSREDILYDEVLREAGYDQESVHETLQEISYLSFLENSLDCAV